MSRSLTFGGALLALTLVLTGCATNDVQESAAPMETTQPEFLTAYGLDGMEAVEVVDQLDRLALADRPTDLMASVMPEHVALSSQDTAFEMALPDDTFYLSIAPYVTQMHECYYHSLTTCEGELSNASVHVKIVDETGEVLVEEDTTTFDNGFVGVWVPRDTAGTIEISYNGMTGTTEFVATDGGATCITDLRLT
ncbi:MAG TPA: CueP family metal-binding protein [Beutenbergiaceae bacterium]|nr:CueP family metal-binding protein [Beutenbergiaceae bacterium]